jgi:hypothetical protein
LDIIYPTEKLKIELELNWYDDLSTVYCINHPDKKARLFTGHLKCQEGIIIAGFCCEDCYNTYESDNTGCFGEWKPEFGINYYDLRKEG